LSASAGIRLAGRTLTQKPLADGKGSMWSLLATERSVAALYFA
jgi:hypothetical protein